MIGILLLKVAASSNAYEVLADGVVMSGKIAVADFICPTEQARTEFVTRLRSMDGYYSRRAF